MYILGHVRGAGLGGELRIAAYAPVCERARTCMCFDFALNDLVPPLLSSYTLASRTQCMFAAPLLALLEVAV